MGHITTGRLAFANGRPWRLILPPIMRCILCLGCLQSLINRQSFLVVLYVYTSSVSRKKRTIENNRLLSMGKVSVECITGQKKKSKLIMGWVNMVHFNAHIPRSSHLPPTHDDAIYCNRFDSYCKPSWSCRSHWSALYQNSQRCCSGELTSSLPSPVAT